MKLLFDQAVRAHQSGRLSEAEGLYRKIISDDPKNFDALHMLGIVCSGSGRTEEAGNFFRSALLIDPHFPPCHVNYGFCLLKQNRIDEAIASFDKALALFPNFAEALFGRGNALREMRRYDDALAAYNRALALKPNLAEAHAACGSVFARLQYYDEAITAYDKALALRPDLQYVVGERLHCKMQLCNWNDFVTECQLLSGSGKNKKIQPHDLLSLPSSAEDQLECAKSWVSEKCPPVKTPIPKAGIYKHDKIRIAYVSSDFRQHATSYLIAGLIESHSRDDFDVIGISLQSEDLSETGQRMKRAFDKFIDVSKMTDENIGQLIRELEIDIAIDLNGHTREGRPNIFARRPAPTQVSYLGFPGPTGASYIDYLVADQTLIPASCQAYYSEKIVYLPYSYQANDVKRAISDKIFTRAECKLPEKGVVFCSFNSAYKILPDVFDRWMRILGQVDGSVLWLLADNDTAKSNLRREAVKRGVSAERLVFAARMPLADHLARHRLADLFLDTFPCNAHTTASDALWACLPVLTQIGETFAARVAASLLHAIDLPELITTTPDAYEKLAIELAIAPANLATIRSRLAENRLTKPLFDTKGFVKQIETAYAAIYERYQAGLPPDNIYVPQ